VSMAHDGVKLSVHDLSPVSVATRTEAQAAATMVFRVVMADIQSRASSGSHRPESAPELQRVAHPVSDSPASHSASSLSYRPKKILRSCC
jgi:hypothetical protein